VATLSSGVGGHDRQANQGGSIELAPHDGARCLLGLTQSGERAPLAIPEGHECSTQLHETADQPAGGIGEVARIVRDRLRPTADDRHKVEVQPVACMSFAHHRVHRAAHAARMREIAEHPLGEQDVVGGTGQGSQRQLDLMLLPYDALRLLRFDVTDLRVPVLHADADVGQRRQRPTAQSFTEHEGGRRMVPAIVGPVDVGLVPALAEEVLDLTERPQLGAGRGMQVVDGTSEDRVRRLRERGTVAADVIAQQDEGRQRCKGIEKSRIDAGTEDDVGGIRGYAHAAEQTRAVGTLATPDDVAQMAFVMWNEIQRFEPSVAADVHQAQHPDVPAAGDAHQIIDGPLGPRASDLGCEALTGRAGQIVLFLNHFHTWLRNAWISGTPPWKTR
jgi:hypothetical protein